MILSLTLSFPPMGLAQELVERLSRFSYKSGEETLRAFEPVSRLTRNSVVKLDLDGVTVALATVIDSSGLAITKASEIRQGKLTCWLATGKEVDVERIRVDEENDLALIKVKAKGLRPIQWAAGAPVVGQWVVTPGIAETPQAVGIVSVNRRKILPKRALIGVQLDFRARGAKILEIMEGFGADKAGLKAGDQILAVNGSAVKESEELVKALRNFREGQMVELRVQREEKEFAASVKMMPPPPPAPEGRGRRGLDREDRMNRMGSEPSERAEGFAQALQHDTVLQNWQCGGPLVNLDGKAIGLNIARAGRVASYALPADLVQRAMHDLRTPPKN
jgi:serine protease Do